MWPPLRPPSIVLTHPRSGAIALAPIASRFARTRSRRAAFHAHLRGLFTATTQYLNRFPTWGGPRFASVALPAIRLCPFRNAGAK